MENAPVPALSGPKVTLLPQGISFAVAPEQTVLQAALANGIELPNSCRNGTCRTCLCHLLQGAVSYRIEWPGVTREEQEAGDFLPCVAYPQGDIVMRIP